MTNLIIVGILIFVAIIAMKLMTLKKKDPDDLPTLPADKGEKYTYTAEEYFFTVPENKFFQILKNHTILKAYVIFSKVRQTDILKPQSNAARGKISQKHVDFVICTPDKFKPILCIELDDKSHDRKDRIERDTFVDQIFSNAGLPLIHVPVQKAYDIRKLNEDIKTAMKKGIKPACNA